MSIINIKNLEIKYNEHIALKNINLTINKNEFICLVGKNGSGKSTLLKAIANLNKKYSGEIVYTVSRSEISYLAQNNMTDIDFPATAKEIIMTGIQKHGFKLFYNKIDETEFKEIVKKLKIEGLINKKIGDLSGGQRQRVLLARTLIGKPKILILDEPCSGLDKASIKTFYKTLDELHQKGEITIIMATHDLDDLSNDKIRVVALDQEIVFDGKIEEYSN